MYVGLQLFIHLLIYVLLAYITSGFGEHQQPGSYHELESPAPPAAMSSTAHGLVVA